MDDARPLAPGPDPGAPTRAEVRRAVESWEALFRAQVAVMRRLAADDIWDEVSLREYDVLFTLSTRENGEARLRDLAGLSLLSQPSISRLVERLEGRGLVRRDPVPDDGRGTLVVLTPEGRRVQARVGRLHAQAIATYVGGALEPAELDTLRALTTDLREAQADLPAVWPHGV